MPKNTSPVLILDQHFMNDTALIRRIVSLAGIRKGETVLEIGAGKGTVTREIAKKAGNVIAVEIDPSLGRELREMGIQNAEIVVENVLDFLDREKPNFDRIVSNTPYSICEALVRRLPKFRFKKGVFAFPKSFAYRLIARQGDKKRSKLSFFAQEFFDIKLMFEIPRVAFRPVPRTSSVAVVLVPKSKSLAAELLMRDKMLLKNALREVFCTGFLGRKATKREARKAINSLKINNKLLVKRVADLDEKEFKHIETIVKRAKI
ncbi:MAG: rRNA adenine dimethyltransferase family protein [Candidatus Aenigmatarchaeota archaeon]